jgi:3-hydroxyacyl-CoA dehydrogenase
MRFGFAASQGPFEAWQQAGWAQVAHVDPQDIAEGKALANVPLPAWVTERSGRRARRRASARRARGRRRGRFVPRAGAPGRTAASCSRPRCSAGEGAPMGTRVARTVFEDESIRLWTLRGVASTMC